MTHGDRKLGWERPCFHVVWKEKGLSGGLQPEVRPKNIEWYLVNTWHSSKCFKTTVDWLSKIHQVLHRWPICTSIAHRGQPSSNFEKADYTGCAANLDKIGQVEERPAGRVTQLPSVTFMKPPSSGAVHPIVWGPNKVPQARIT